MRRGSRLSPARVDTIRKEILTAYARLGQSGRPVTCRAPEKEIAYRSKHRLPPLKDKVIFDTVERAKTCAERMSLVLGIKIMRAYQCPRSTHGHFHLTSNMQERKRGAS